MATSHRRALSRIVGAVALFSAACSSDAAPGGAAASMTGSGGSAGGTGGMTSSGGAGGAGAAGSLGGWVPVDSDGGTGGAVGDGAASPDGSCGQSLVLASSRPVSMLLVIDRSGSMTAKPATFTTDKWTAMKTAVIRVINDVKDIAYGLELFPNSLTTPIASDCGARCWEVPPGDSAVVVPVASGADQVMAIAEKLETPPTGGTPTASALKAALDYFVSGAGQSLVGDRYVLLATDGGPNGALGASCERAQCTTNIDRGDLTGSSPNYCDAQIDPQGPRSCLDEAGTLAQLTALAAAGIKTFVVGIPGSEPYVPALDAFAVAGGAAAPSTPRYYAVSAAGDVDGLTATFTNIAKRLITTCNLRLETTPPDLGKLNVTVDGTVVLQGPDGWELDTSMSPPAVMLKGDVCRRVQDQGAQSVQILFGCPTAVIN